MRPLYSGSGHRENREKSGLIVLGLTLAASLHAYVVPIMDGQPLRWDLVTMDDLVHTNVVNRSTKAIRFFLASDAYSSANAAAELNAIRAAFAQWTLVPGTSLKFEEGGLVAPGMDINNSDNTNVVFWAKQSTLVNGGLNSIAGLPALTIFSFFEDNHHLAEADIVFNGAQFGWFTDINNPRGSQYFVEGVALHEIGHFIGLSHTPVGGATMMWRTATGLSPYLGLSADEWSAARALYPSNNILSGFGRVLGKVTMNGAPVFGAAVLAHNANGNLVSGSLSGRDGAYELPALAPGNYQIRVTPLDPGGSGDILIRGQDISLEFSAAETGFVPTTNLAVSVVAGANRTLNVSVTPGDPPFRITRISEPSSDSNFISLGRGLAVSLRLGESKIVGVASQNFPTNGIKLLVPGDGITLGETSIREILGYRILLAPVTVSASATPGLRSFVVQLEAKVACANGFLEILPTISDDNLDGLDDLFQRTYFPLFTAAEAAPKFDADGDGFSNAQEYIAGSIPTNALSVLRIERVTVSANGGTVVWRSGAGRRYQLLSRDDVLNSSWQPVGTPVTATGPLTEMVDPAATNQFRFYRVQAIP